jgi:excisionase family DNA binding protein|tara:strand:- start:94 stop:387 length:294 start_codon:yes stop_codon:yes gene_type:complete
LKKLFTLTQVSELTSTPVSTLRKWAKDKTFPAFKLPSGAWRITEEDYEDWLVQVKERGALTPLSKDNPELTSLREKKGGLPYGTYVTTVDGQPLSNM